MLCTTQKKRYIHNDPHAHGCSFINVKGFRLLQHYLINPNCGASEKKAKSKKCIDKTVKKEKKQKTPKEIQRFKRKKKEEKPNRTKKNYNQFNYFYEIVCLWLFFTLSCFDFLYFSGRET